MTQLVLFREGNREYVVIDTQDLTDAEFAEEYGAKPVYRADVSGTIDLTPFPTDRELRAD